MLPSVHLRLFVSRYHVVLVLPACVFIWIVPLKKSVYLVKQKEKNPASMRDFCDSLSIYV